jgi:hypothetical protein
MVLYDKEQGRQTISNIGIDEEKNSLKQDSCFKEGTLEDFTSILEQSYGWFTTTSFICFLF